MGEIEKGEKRDVNRRYGFDQKDKQKVTSDSHQLPEAVGHLPIYLEFGFLLCLALLLLASALFFFPLAFLK